MQVVAFTSVHSLCRTANGFCCCMHGAFADHPLLYTCTIQLTGGGCHAVCPAQGEPLSVCNVEGYPIQVAAACSANPKCKAFTTSDGYGGYLKAAAAPTTYTEKSVTYAKA